MLNKWQQKKHVYYHGHHISSHIVFLIVGWMTIAIYRTYNLENPGKKHNCPLSMIYSPHENGDGLGMFHDMFFCITLW